MKFESIVIDGIKFYEPQDKQKQFHNSILNRAENGYRDFLYGGAAKGGKSYALRWEAHRNCIQYPRLRGLLVRSSFPELERTHLSQIIFDLPVEVGSYNSQKHIFKYFNDSVLEFGYGSTLNDFQQYLSANYDFILVDEMTTIPFDLTYMFRLRLESSRSDFIPFFAGATNPGSKAHVQVRNYFVRKNASTEDYPNYNPKAIYFIPATVYDNVILMDRDPEILKRLQQLPYKEQQKYLYGNWDIFEGQMFDFNTDIHVVKERDYLTYAQLLNFNVASGLDYGNVTVLECVAKDHNNNFILFDELYQENKTRNKKIAETKEFLDYRGLTARPTIADTNMWIKDAFDVDYSSMPAVDYTNNGITLIPVSKKSPDKDKGYREACNDFFKDILEYKIENGKLVQAPKFRVYERCRHFIDTFPALIIDPKNPDDIESGQQDHEYDAAKMVTMWLRRPKEAKKEEPRSVHAPTVKNKNKLSDPSLRM